MSFPASAPIIKTIYDNSCGDLPAGREAGTGGAGGLWESNVEDLDIGNVLQNCRSARNISLRQLAEKTGMTASMLSQIERNLVNPSINTLKLISMALDVPMYKFFLSEEEDRDLVVRRDARITLGRPETEDIVYELLTANVSGDIEFCMMHVPGKNDSHNVETMHHGEEVAYVVKGRITVYVNDVPYELEEGDSVLIPPESLHRWKNDGDEECDVLFAITPPSF